MGSILAIDEGNSSTKATIFQGDLIVKETKFQAVTDYKSCENADLHGADGCIYSSVGQPEAALRDYLRGIYGHRLLTLDHATALPITISYDSRLTLGTDRIAAAAGAAWLHPGAGMAVADAGTALTIDYVSPGGRFMGGNISAGLRMRLASLHSHTAKLPAVSPEGELPQYGHDTETALRCGAVRGAAAEISTFARRCGAQIIMLTGGDAPLLAPVLKEENEITVESCRHLVATGLRIIYEYNETK